MGTFCTNIVVRTPDAKAVAATLADARRDAYVAPVEGGVIVYDQKCDEQDMNEIVELARRLSREHACEALGVLVHDSDIFAYTLCARGEPVDVYNSWPGYFDGAEPAPDGGDAARLCDAFGVPEQRAEVDELLRSGSTDADTLLGQVAESLGLPAVPMSFGYNAVAHDPEGLELDVRRVGGAPSLGAGITRMPLPPQPTNLRARPPLDKLLGDKPVSMSQAFSAVIQYVHAHTGFEPDGVTFRCDDTLRAIFGADRYRVPDAARRLIELLAVVD